MTERTGNRRKRDVIGGGRQKIGYARSVERGHGVRAKEGR